MLWSPGAKRGPGSIQWVGKMHLNSARAGISGKRKEKKSLLQAAFLEVLAMIWACPFVHRTSGPSKKHLWG